MKKLIALLLMTLLVAPVASQPLTAPLQKPRIRTIVALGKGIAVSKEDATDFEIVKLGIARVRMSLVNETRELSVGVLWVGDNRYKVKDISLENDTVEANVYSNNTLVGKLAITSVVKQKETVWVGELEIGEKKYTVYILEGVRKFQPVEVKESISEYCEEHPVKCAQIAKGIATQYCSAEKAQTESCREKIVEYCKDHPNDQRCVALKRAYCVLHPEDMRCRFEMRDYCLKHPNDEKCKGFCKLHPLACGKKSAQVKQQVKQKIKKMIQFGIKKQAKQKKVSGQPLTPPLLPS